MINKREAILLTEFRKDARQPLTRISRKTGIPVSTIFDKLRQYEGNIIKKHTALLNFKELGYDLRVNFLFSVIKDEKETFLGFLLNSLYTNNVFKINGDYDFLVECVFKNMSEFQNFIDRTSAFDVKRKEHFVLEELKKEAFFVDINHLNLF